MRWLLLFSLLIVACPRNSPEPEPRSKNDRPAAVAQPRNCTPGWQEVVEGLEYRALNCSSDGSEFDFHLVRMDLSRWDLDAVRTDPTTVDEVARRTSATVAVNANFFDPEYRPLGLIVSGGRELQRPHPVEWESIFLVRTDDQARIVLPARWAQEKTKAKTAVQAGPRIVIDGKLTRVVPGDPVWRSGVCVEKSGRVVFFVTPPARLMTASEAGELVYRDIGCRDAMLFDGGPSAQMYLERPQGDIIIKGDDVPVFVVARRRTT